MSKFTNLIFLVCLPFLSWCQNSFNLKGELTGVMQKKDSIYLFGESILTSDYYETVSFSAKIEDNKFLIKGKLSYPQMYRVRLKSETGKIPYKNGFYFIDSSSSLIRIDDTNQMSSVNGKSGNEFKQKFLPYFIDNDKRAVNFDLFIFNNEQEFESILLNYVNQNPNSYVALWFLINSLNNHGYSDTQNKILNSFSKKIKSGKLWNVVNNEIQNIKLKVGAKFPELQLKNTELNKEVLAISKGGYTLIDFWFSRCVPCLAQLPHLKEIYKKYNAKGFNIISISTDLTENVKPYWQKRIVEKEISWKNLLDENAKEASQEKIFSFPTNFLLDKDGNIIAKNIPLDDLDKYLAIHSTEIFYDRKKF